MYKGMLVFYSVLGVVLCLGGIFMMAFGELKGNNISVLVGGVIMYVCSIPLLFQVKLFKIEERITALENKMKK